MRNSIFDYVGNLDTLIAVIIGAILATFGALIAELIQDRSNRKRRERDAARFFGDILMTIDQILNFTFNSQKIGDRWGRATMRLFKTALREAAVYERNRERLFDLHDIHLRSSIHSYFLMKTVPLEALIETDEKIIQAEKFLKNSENLADKQVQVINQDILDYRESLETALATIKREKAKTIKICHELQILARLKFFTTLATDDIATPAQSESKGELIN